MLAEIKKFKGERSGHRWDWHKVSFARLTMIPRNDLFISVSN